MKAVLITLPLMFAAIILSGCANHPLDCAMGFYHSDCLPDSAAFQKAEAAKKDDDATCRSYGLIFGSAEYAQCRQNIVNQRDANKRAAAAAYLGTLSKPAPTVPYQMPVSPNVNCTTSYAGNQAYTNCH